MRQRAANAPVHGWAVPAPTPSTPSRKTPECEVDDPEGNLAIVERVGHESQQYFADWEYSRDGTAHKFVAALHTALYCTPLVMSLQVVCSEGASKFSVTE